MEARYHKLRKVTDKSVTLRPKKELLQKRKSLSNNLRYLSEKKRDLPPLTPLHRLRRFKAIRDKNLKSKLRQTLSKNISKMEVADKINGEVSDNEATQEADDPVCSLKTKPHQGKPEINGQNGFLAPEENISNGHNSVENGHAGIEESEEVTPNVAEEESKSIKDIEEEEEVDVEVLNNEESNEKEDYIAEEDTELTEHKSDTEFTEHKSDTESTEHKSDTDFREHKEDSDFREEKFDTVFRKVGIDFREEKEDTDLREEKADSDLRKEREKSLESDRGSSSSASTFVSNKEFLPSSSEEMLETIQTKEENRRFSISDGEEEEEEEIDVETDRISSTESEKVSVSFSQLKEKWSESMEVENRLPAAVPRKLPRSVSSSSSYKTAYGGSLRISGRRAMVPSGRGKKRKPEDEDEDAKERGSPSQPSPRWKFFHSSVTKLWSPSTRDLFSNSAPPTPLRNGDDSMAVNLNEESITAHMNDPDIFYEARNVPVSKKPRWGCIVM